jgi:hypothetical protein
MTEQTPAAGQAAIEQAIAEKQAVAAAQKADAKPEQPTYHYDADGRLTAPPAVASDTPPRLPAPNPAQGGGDAGPTVGEMLADLERTDPEKAVAYKEWAARQGQPGGTTLLGGVHR